METAIDTHEEQETAPKQPNKWVKFAKDLSEFLLSFTWSFLVILAVAGLAFLLTRNYVVSIIAAAATFAAFNLYLHYNWNYRKEGLLIARNFFAWIGFALVSEIATLSIHDVEHTGGLVLWSIVIAVALIAIGYLYFEERDSTDSFLENVTKYDFFRKMLFLVLTFLFASLVYMDWATQWVWVPIVVYSLYAYTFDNHSLKFETDRVTLPIVASVLLGIVSTVWQFFFTDLFTIHGFTIKLWFVLSILAGIAIVIFAIKGWFDYTKNKAIKAEQAIQAEKERAANAEKSRIAEEEKQKKYEEDKQICLQLKDTLEQAENPSWREIQKLSDLVDQHRLLDNCKASEKTVSNASLLVFFTVSEEKKQISWNYSELRAALSRLHTIADKSLDDADLKGMKRQIAELEKFSEYRGYKDLTRQVKDFVYLSYYFKTSELAQ